MNSRKNFVPNRRNVLRTVAGGASISTLTRVVSAASDDRVSGVTYDTLTHQTGPNANGSVSKDSNGTLQGRLNIGGYVLPIQKVKAVKHSGPGERYVASYTNHRYIKDDNPLKLDFFVYGDQIFGHLTRPGKKYGKLGFLLFDDQDQRSYRAREVLTPDSRWENSDHSFKVPENGVPTDSGIGRRMKIMGKNSEGGV